MRSRAEGELLGTLFWSAKEAATKALGVGLRLDVREVAVEVANRSTEAWSGFGVRFREERLHGWWQRYGGFVLTVVDRWSGRPPLPLDHDGGRALLRTTLVRISQDATASAG